MNLAEWLRTAAIFIVVLFCLVVFIDWLNYMDLQRRLRKEREGESSIRIWKGETITGIALEDIEAYVPVVVSDSTAPGDALLIAPDVYEPDMETGEVNIDPNKVVKITNLEEEEK